MTRAAVLLSAAALMLLAGPVRAQAIAPDESEFLNQAEQKARLALEQMGYTIQRLYATPRWTGNRDSYQDLNGAIVWAEVAECPQGEVAVNVNDFLDVTSVYGRYGCQVASLPQ